MPRTRVKTDADVLDAALVVVRELGPAALTFAALSARVGLAPSTLVQRFGTKAGLLQAALLRAWDLLDEETAVADERSSIDVPGAVDLLVRLSGTHERRDFPDQLLVLREDLRDPVLRRRGTAWLATLERAIDRRMGSGTPGLGAVLVTHWQGALTVWGFTPEVALTAAVRDRLTALVERLRRS